MNTVNKYIVYCN